MKKYNLVNNTLGWISFVIAAITYLLTIEPTASFWDCGEFITSSYKFEVGHPPGAPFFMLTAKFFTLFAPDTSKVAMMVNSMSAIMSALTILFLFWTITHLAKKLIYTDHETEMTVGQLIAIMGSGFVGALVYTFSDTFWFSAVEGEVYGYSSMFTALVFWLILKWENRADQEGSDKWLVLIAYVMGLSIGVHLLNLLCIPAIVLVYYFRKAEKPKFKGLLLALIGSLGLVVVLMYGVIPGFAKVGGWFELFLVNDLGLSYNSGVFTYLILLFISIVWGLYETLAEKGSLVRAKIAFIICLALSGILFIGSGAALWIILFLGAIVFCFKSKAVTFRMLNTSLLCLLVVLIGYSSFALIPIRSTANTPMDQNSPESVFALADYLNREQYGDSPLFYGRTYASEVKRNADGEPVVTSEKKKYDKIVKKSPDEKDRYFVSGIVPTYEYSNNMLFPRMYSKDHFNGYTNWADVKNPKVTPTLMQNLQYLFSYQLNFMYWRYFMWNFSGRQNDIQSRGGITNGNWITGINFIDEHVLGLGPQDDLPPDIAENKGHNVYYMLPLILGIFGILYQLSRGKKGEQQLWVTFMLFFMTGIAIVLYLNQKTSEPRERDYAFAGSFYAFSIWIGLGVAGIWTVLKKYVPERIAAIIASVVTLLVPLQMLSQNWDDHDRSNRYTMRDFGMNYLRSVEKDGIIFTNGDNDTFPLWYAQEVEGFRTDVRVTNLSYLQTDWYVDQMRREAYDSPPLPIEWANEQYIGDRGSYAYVISKKDIEQRMKQYYEQQNSGDSDWLNKLNSGELNIDYTSFYDTNAFKDNTTLDEVMTIMKTNERYVPKNPFIKEDKSKNDFIIPATTLLMPIDTNAVDWERFNSKPRPFMAVNLNGKNVVYRHELMIMELLNNINKDGWKRPIYFATTVGSDMYMNLTNQFVLEGLTYRIVPGEVNKTGVNTDVAFDNMVNKFKWGGIENPSVYLDEQNLRMSRTFRVMFNRLISALYQEGKTDKALEALEYCLKVIPPTTVPMMDESVGFADMYFKLGQPEKAEEIIEQISDRANKSIKWYNRLKPNQLAGATTDIVSQFEPLRLIALTYRQNGFFEKYEDMTDDFLSYAQIYYNGRIPAVANYILKELADESLRAYFNTPEDSPQHAQEEKVIEKIMGMMRQYSPGLYEKYVNPSNN